MQDLHPSAWQESVTAPEFLPLSRDLYCDVCVVGAGVTGLAVAYHLLLMGKSVIVLDKETVGAGETAKTTAHLSSVLDDRFFKLEKWHGALGARLAYQSHRQAIQRIEEICRLEEINCDFEFVDGYLFSPAYESAHILEYEFAACQRIGIEGLNRLARVPGLSFDTGLCLHFPKQAQFHPLKFLYGLAKAIEKKGGKIFSQARVENFEGGVLPCVYTHSGYKVEAKHLVVATDSPINDRFVMHTKQAAYRSYVITSHIPKGEVPKGLYWDTADPYHYVRLQNWNSCEDLLIVGGEDHKTGQEDHPEARFRALEIWACARFPMMKKVEFRWSGQVMEPIDGLGYIGHNPMDFENVYIATGDSGHGMTHAMIAGILISDLIHGRATEWETLYSPKRKTLRSFSEFFRENFNTALQYKDWLRFRSPDDVSSLAKKEGMVMRVGSKKVAVYKDELGDLHLRSAICPHLEGIVHWNSFEKTWDCPCHGSRFDCKGQVLNGPALTNLNSLVQESEVDLPSNKANLEPARS